MGRQSVGQMPGWGRSFPWAGEDDLRASSVRFTRDEQQCRICATERDCTGLDWELHLTATNGVYWTALRHLPRAVFFAFKARIEWHCRCGVGTPHQTFATGPPTARFVSSDSWGLTTFTHRTDLRQELVHRRVYLAVAQHLGCALHHIHELSKCPRSARTEAQEDDSVEAFAVQHCSAESVAQRPSNDAHSQRCGQKWRAGRPLQMRVCTALASSSSLY
ncbi:unnamed protein product [Lampetra planeri]